MNAFAIAQYMRRLVDDPGVVSFPLSLQASMLEIAYEEFRQYAPQELWEIRYSTAVTNVFQIDLNNILFGSAPTNTRAMRLTRVQRVDPSTGQLLTVFSPASSFETLGQVSAAGPAITNSLYLNAKWWLDGQILRFNIPVTGTIEIWYLPVQTINWQAAIQPGANTFVDDLPQWHDIIALLAAQQYYIKEGQGNRKCDEQLSRRLAKMEQFFAETRSGQGSRYVVDEAWR